MSEELKPFEEYFYMKSRAISDPGSFTPRAENFGEALGHWQARAIEIAVAGFKKSNLTEQQQAARIAELEKENERIKREEIGPYQCYWRDRAFQAEKQIEEYKKVLRLHGVIFECQTK